MFGEFLSKNSRTLTIIGVLLGLWLLLYILNSDKTEEYLNHPKVGQVYIFEQEKLFAPIRLDSLSKTHMYMRNYLFLFSDAIPKQEQIEANEFDLNFYAIYEKKEMKRLYSVGKLVKIYP